MAAELAKCRGCGGSLKHEPVLMSADEGDEKHTFIIPSYHSECVPEERKAGSRWLLKK